MEITKLLVIMLLICMSSMIAMVKSGDINFNEFNVKELNSKNIDSTIKSSKQLLIYFYSKSKDADKLLKIFTSTSQSLHDDGSDVVFGFIDLEKNHNIKQKNGLEVSEFGNTPTLSNFKAFAQNPMILPTTPKMGPWGVQSLVHYVTDRTAASLIRTRPKVLMMFYSPQCGHCERMKPAYAEASIEVQKRGLGVFAAIDCTLSSAFCNKFNIKGFPTVLLFEKGAESMVYQGDRSTNDLINWFEKQADTVKKQQSLSMGDKGWLAPSQQAV
ncbi:hypothetical protein DFA_01703 [Cavenderia fasciculata]|uniref:Thioredoxin domain-containing protein n=1 Tax=Cavenderia fasciculata TaxID=261658 RepID=F4PUA2_CACFS|nr:uncharacterized protein DFA_01703 [Cavenderia fasciculata]EGG21817.1 hypothetical protein DFA_01703 [Cavenderia fasciculata]|eukprot:XP_004359667.1 hypothetical protein DFA_01703 [Cavenderia fasciculata]